MASAGGSRWADSREDLEAAARRKEEKERKKRAKAEKAQQQQQQQQSEARAADASELHRQSESVESAQHAPKRRRLEDAAAPESPKASGEAQLLTFPRQSWGPCRHVDNFEKLNHIEEGSYGWVSRAREVATGEIVALKKLKMSGEKDGLPVTGLREIQTLSALDHENIVKLREVVCGTSHDDVFLVMDFIEHDLRSLLEDMPETFLLSEAKTLLLQLISGVDFLHGNWILHRDLKSSNLLLNNRGQLKIADFGMARYSGDPPPRLTQVVTTLWYRAPELILGAQTYGPEIDMWSVGCIFGELLGSQPLFQGKNEVDQLSKIFKVCGIPNEETWPGFRRLPNARSLRLPSTGQIRGTLRSDFTSLTSAGVTLLKSLVALDPQRRPTAREALSDAFFAEKPRPKSSAMFPTFPSKAGQEKRRHVATPSAHRAQAAGGNFADADFSGLFSGRADEEAGAGFRLRMG